MAAKIAEYRISVRPPNIVQLRADCGDGRVCVFSAERAKCLGILMVAELADYAFSARFTSVISFVMVAAFAADAQCLCAICWLRGGGICVFNEDAHCFLDL